MVQGGDIMHTVNPPPDLHIPQTMEYFKLSAAPNTRLWRQKVGEQVSTAPIVYSIERDFLVAEVNVMGEYLTEMDQGGLVLFFDRHPTHGSSPLTARTGEWVKVGFEICDGQVYAVSEHAASRGTDKTYYFVSPYITTTFLTSSNLHFGVKLQRNNETLDLWYQPEPTSSSNIRDVNDSWLRLGQITGFFPPDGKSEVCVGVFASRPSNAPDNLVVEFEDLDIL